MQLIGHKETKEQIDISVKSAKKRNASIPHMLFAGVAGCGKTSMSKLIAHKNDTDFLSVPAQEFKDHESVMDILERLSHAGYDERGNRLGENSLIKPTILFVDEIHRMPIVGEEHLGIAMEEYRMASGKEGNFYWIPYFTLIGATTDDGSLSKPFRERFKMRFVFDPYSDEEIADIIKLYSRSKEIDMEMTPRSVRRLTMRSRGIPRMAKGYLERVRDLRLSISGSPTINSSLVEETFKRMGIDEEGLTKVELKILQALCDAGIPLGLDNLSVVVNESPKTLSASAEPFLIRKGFVLRSGKGRVLTKKGRDYLGKIGARKKVEISADYVRK
jgi:Holliday junction DNA helicase RuvB